MDLDEELAARFVRENWSALAASAWRFHMFHGPGALILEWVVVQRWCRDPTFLCPPGYATTTENADFNAVIARYDPRTAIVVGFVDRRFDDGAADGRLRATRPVRLRPGIALASMTITGEPSPPDAHRARGH
jgi:hypothetical protein